MYTDPIPLLSLSLKGDEPDDAQVPSKGESNKKEQDVCHVCKRITT